MLRTLRRLPPFPKRTYSTTKQPPPPAGPYKPTNAQTPAPAPPSPPPSKPTSAPKPASQPAPTPAFPPKPDPLDPVRGAAASLKAAREGVLDPRYKPASRRVVAIICAVPIFLVTSWVLFQRQFMGVEQKMHTPRKSEGGEDGGVEVVDAK